jgi:hypothetical protein
VATIVDLRDSSTRLPSFLLLDANMLLELLNKNAHIDQFFRRLGQSYSQGLTIPLVCILSLEECYHKIIVGKYKTDTTPVLLKYRQVVAAREGVSPARVQWQVLYKGRPKLMQRFMKDVDAFHHLVASIPVQVVEPEDLVGPTRAGPLLLEQQMRDAMRSYCLLGKDAYLVAVATRLEVKHIASLDADFRRLGQDFNLYCIP